MARGRPKLAGRDAIRAALGRLSGGRPVTIEIVEEELVVAGDWAWSVAEFAVTYGSAADDEPPGTDHGRALLIYQKGSDGRWRIHRDIDTHAPDVSIAPPKPK